ncbi:SAM domain-containing protein [Nephila pilipes]|uniref:SAM domain-containing protein n=1 Tax=Nephila pilipes TaxID=299642 RepID=A0A8X6T7J2_NEPPI|nr:SAM domain-containing protein [Nephila pilipes]
MAQINRLPHEYSQQIPGNAEADYATSTGASQQCSLYSSQPEDSSAVQQNATSSSSENASVTEYKPALPPKPFQGPPVYREPPTPPIHDESIHHPDICINSATSSHQRPNENATYSHPPHLNERPDRLGSRTHAWVQEHKTSGKLVGEKLSSLQRKLRSFLSQSSSKELTELEKTSSLEEPKVEIRDNWNFHSAAESTRRPRPFSSVAYNMNTASANDQLNYISASSFSSNSVALSLPQATNHAHHYKPFQPERHPFAASANLSEHEDATDPDQMRDTCNKLFAREQRISWTNYLNPRNSYSNNIKSTYDYDKLVPKEVIGRPSQDKKPEISANCEAIYGGVTPFPSFAKALEISSKQTEQQSSRTTDGSYYAKRVQNFSEETSTPIGSSETKVPSEEPEASSADALPTSTTDCGDATDVYKSSSESGRGTMHSSMHGSKSVVSPHSSGVSAASNLDTSIDSDHSASGAIWSQQNRGCQDKRFPEEFQVNKVKHIYETPNTSGVCRQANEKEGQDDASSESLSVTPPLPPLSPAPSPPASAENSPKLSSRAKYKLSLSASALNSCYGKSSDHQQKICEMPSKSTSGKKSGVRRTTSINQSTCRHRSGKSSQYTKASTSGHRLGIAHSNCASRKCNSSPPSRHHSRPQLAYPCYLDNADPELTSTTTGLDMESLLDDDDYSSDLSATASTMEPNEVSMIRKQLEGLETMYSEILRLLGVKNSCKANVFASSLDVSRHSRRKLNGSLSSLTGRSSTSRGNHSFVDKRGFSEKRRTKECRTSSASKRLQRLESHVVTLARSVAHLSSEMRTQHVLVQELENMRQDVTWVQERLRLMQLAQGCHPSNAPGKGHQLAMHRDWDNFHKEVLELLNPSRAKKLTKFFGDEPPLIRQFLKRLGYEKYATNFENEKIGIKELPYLTEERLQKMGIPMGPRIRILQEAQTCCPQNQYKVYIV